MKPCQDYVKLFSASTGYKSSESVAYVCVFADMLWSHVHVYEIIIAALEP